MVFNRQTYPNLFRLFQELNVPIKNADMSFSVQHFPLGIEYCGSSLNQLFAQRKNLIRPKFWRMLLQINRFNKEAVATLQSGEFDSFTLAEYVKEKKYDTLKSKIQIKAVGNSIKNKIIQSKDIDSFFEIINSTNNTLKPIKKQTNNSIFLNFIILTLIIISTTYLVNFKK